MATLTECFKYYGAVKRNRSSWSARSPDDKVVVVTIWADLLDESGPIALYKDLPRGVAQNPFGTKERTENLKWAKEHLDGVFRVVVVTAVDPTVQPRKTGKREVREDLIMKVTDLEVATGYFEAVAIGGT